MNKKMRKNNKGFFLMDVLVSFGIIALLATISIPYLKKYQPNLKLNGASRDLTADLRYAQQLTVTEQVAHSVDFSFEDDSYEILRLGVATTTIKTVALDPDVSFQEISSLSGDRVIFNFYGGVSEAGQVTLVNTNDKTAIIDIKPSGYIQLGQ